MGLQGGANNLLSRFSVFLSEIMGGYNTPDTMVEIRA